MRISLCLGFAVALAASASGVGTLYAINDTGNSLVQIDPDTFALTPIGGTGVTGGDFGDLSWDPVNGKLWWIAGRGNDSLYTVDTTTGLATLVGSHGVNDLFALAFDTVSGRLYAQSTNQSVYTLNMNTGAATLIGSNAVYPGGYAVNGAGQLVLLEAGGGKFFSIDRNTGAATQISAGAGFVNDNGITWDGDRQVYWVDDWSGNLYKYDASFNRTTALSGLGSYDGIAYVPEPASFLVLAGALLLRRR